MKKNKKIKPELQSWYQDRYQLVLVQRKLMAVITLAALAGAFLCVLVILELLPLKSVEPYVIQVDPRTGITETVDPLTVRKFSANEAINNYFLTQYVRAREGYNAVELLHNYNLVRLMSDDKNVYPQFQQDANPNNPQSNITRLGTTGTRTVRFRSITTIAPQVVQIRLVINERLAPTGDATELHRIATIKYEYVPTMNLSTEERYLNPLGFRVTEYQLSEDALAP